MAITQAPPVLSPDHHPPTKGTAIFGYICIGLTGTAIILVLIIFCRYRVRRRAPVTATGAQGDTAEEQRQVGVDITKLPEFAYTESSRRRSGGNEAQCSVCLGAVHPGEKVRRLPVCKHLYHVECIDMWFASHATCPVCRADVEPPGENGQAAPAAEQEQEQAQVPPV